MKQSFLLLTLSIVACVPKNESADSTAFAVVDTLKPAVVDSVVQTDTTSPAPATKAPATKTKTTSTQAAPATKKDTTNIGRDRAIKINTKDPRVRIPTVDTTKRPPQ